MVRRHLDRPFRFVCLTDRKIEGIERIRIDPVEPLKGWWAKINLFKPGLFTGRVLYLDLDVLVVAALAPIVDFPARFALIPDGAPHFFGGGHRRVVKRFNSSVMVWDADCNTQLYEHWSPDVAKRLWGDQDWIGEQLPEECMMPLEWFPRLSEVTHPWPETAKVILCKQPKNIAAARRWPWFAQAWG